MTDVQATTTERRRVRLLHGDIDSGKTRRAAHWAETEGFAGRTVGGVLAIKTPQRRRFLDLLNGDDVALEHPADDEPGVTVGRFRFRQVALDWAAHRIEAAAVSGVTAVIIDEVGPLEMRGEGFAALIDRLSKDHPAVELVLLVRTGLIDAVAQRFARDADCVLDPPL